MKRLVLAALIAASLMATRAEAGLVWTVKANMSVRQRPGLEGVELVRANGIHRVTVTDMGIYTEFFLRVKSGALVQNAVAADGCSTDWLHVKEVSSVVCMTTVVQSPCVDGVWEAVTTGQIKFITLFKKTEIGVSEPVFVNCSCI
jgi:hypothetical protein